MSGVREKVSYYPAPLVSPVDCKDKSPVQLEKTQQGTYGTIPVKLGKAPLVYFKATLTKSSNSVAAFHFGVNRIMLFSSVEANIGLGYNPTSGVFVAPESGYYQFRTILQTTREGNSDFALVAQGSSKAFVSIPNHWSSTTMSAIFHVNRGDHVFVKKIYDNGNAPLRQGLWSQFSGYLLRID